MNMYHTGIYLNTFIKWFIKYLRYKTILWPVPLYMFKMALLASNIWDIFGQKTYLKLLYN